MIRLRPWQWAGVVLGLCLYFVWAGFQVYGGIFLGWPPFVPAWLSNTRLPVVRGVVLDKPRSVVVFGEITEGRVVVVLDGVRVVEVVGQFSHRFVVPPGRHELRLENDASFGWLNYRLE